MRITHDSEVDALYVRFIETTVTTKHLAEGIVADYDAEGRLAGIEILDTVKRTGPTPPPPGEEKKPPEGGETVEGEFREV
jgi:uncharacterized protein YuzE